MKATVESARGSVEKLSPKESVKGADIVLRAVWGLLRDFPRANPRLQNREGTASDVLQPRVCLEKIPREPSHSPAAQCRHLPKGLSWGDSSSTRIVTSCSDY